MKRHLGDLRRAIVGSDIDPDTLNAAQEKRWVGWQRRDGVNGAVRSLHGQGHGIEGIVRTTGVSRRTVHRILAGPRDDVHRSRSSPLDRWAERLRAAWDGGCRNGAESWRRLRSADCRGSLGVVTEWATRQRRSTAASLDRPAPILPVLPAPTIGRLLTRECDCRSDAALPIRVAVKAASSRIVAARNLLDRFRAMVVTKKTDDLTVWLDEAAGSELTSFTSGVRNDEAAVRAAVVQP